MEKGERRVLRGGRKESTETANVRSFGIVLGHGIKDPGRSMAELSIIMCAHSFAATFTTEEGRALGAPIGLKRPLSIQGVWEGRQLSTL